MAGKYFDLDLDKNLGGENASDITVASQKAVKDYVDEKVGAIVDKDTDKLKDLKDVKLTNIEDNQSLVYDKTTETWVNKNVASSWGNISGTLESQTDLKEALNNKANKTDLPTKVSQLDNDAGYLTTHQDISGKANTADLAKVATSGSYDDLSNKPTIPTAVTTETVAGWGYTKNTGTVTQVKVNGTAKSPTNGVVDLGTVLTAHQSLASYIKGLSVSGKTITYTKGDNTTDTITTQDTTYSAGTGITISGGKISLAAHNQASNTITALTGYKKATTASAIAAEDSLNTALGKLEYKCENATVSKITVGMLAN